MTTPSSISEQILAVPSGAGGISGLGETFTADPFTGTGRYRIPIPVPAGHGGLKPDLALVYSSGAGAGICGMGWPFGVGAVSRRTEKGIPRFTGSDVFVLGCDAHGRDPPQTQVDSHKSMEARTVGPTRHTADPRHCAFEPVGKLWTPPDTRHRDRTVTLPALLADASGGNLG